MITVRQLLYLAIVLSTNAFQFQALQAPTRNSLPFRPNLASPARSLTQRHTRAETTTTTLRMVSSSLVRTLATDRLPSSKVVEAVSQLSSKSPDIIASDVSAAAGISISEARSELTLLASLSQGDIAVSSDGELIYQFPDNLGGVLSGNSQKYKLRALWDEKVFPPLFYVLRVSFGIALLVSIAAIFSTIAILQSSSSDDRDDRRDSRRGGMGGGMGFGGLWGPSPLDFFYYRPYYSPYSRGGAVAVNDPNEEQEMGFLEAVFSYVFGDGDPNRELDSKRLQLASTMIRENNGAVTAEQLAPFCDDAPLPGNDQLNVDESFVLPIVSKLDGVPSVTDDGTIVYVFSELQTSAQAGTASSGMVVPRINEPRLLQQIGLPPNAPGKDIKRFLERGGIDTRGCTERKDVILLLNDVYQENVGNGRNSRQPVEETDLLVESEYEFTGAKDLFKFGAGALGIVNLGGALYLGNLLSSPALVGVQLPSYMGLVQAGQPLLLGYAILYNLIPAVRNFVIKGKNEKIKERNKIRRSWRTVVQTGVGKVGQKLASAKRFGSRRKLLKSSGDDVYSTKTSTEDMTKQKEGDAMADFDKLLAGDEPSKDWE
eukprot:CAMPEP_0194370146 /NCGR_PEP_ID=MMETSP0174-20130528/18453_1 /TAXON_ID=216777 /ORGANISM="Proboscia alata, Strain PI-D3" /LENGTH=599 /DNA_ID=CAMNT_0039147447 /DNA_START=167 /DNA_END=1966 /DNA_ORIENTATION=+